MARLSKGCIVQRRILQGQIVKGQIVWGPIVMGWIDQFSKDCQSPITFFRFVLFVTFVTCWSPFKNKLTSNELSQEIVKAWK
jgi:hypothetical protein